MNWSELILWQLEIRKSKKVANQALAKKFTVWSAKESMTPASSGAKFTHAHSDENPNLQNVKKVFGKYLEWSSQVSGLYAKQNNRALYCDLKAYNPKVTDGLYGDSNNDTLNLFFLAQVSIFFRNSSISRPRIEGLFFRNSWISQPRK